MKLRLLSFAILFVVCVFGGLLLFFRLLADGPVISVALPGVSTSGGTVSTMSVDPVSDRGASAVRPDRHSAAPGSFYQTIIDNNLFRPLNWEPPHRESAYRLLGTTIASDGGSAAAYIQERASNKFYAVSVGQQVGGMTVQTITAKRVTLIKQGNRVTLFLNRALFLNPRPSRSTSAQEMLPPSVTTQQKTPHTATAKDTPDTAREWRKALEEKAAKIRAERKRMQDFLHQYEKR